MKGDIAFVRIDALVAKIRNPMALMDNLKAAAMAEGATLLRVEAIIAEAKGDLRRVLSKRYGMRRNDKRVDLIIMSLK